MLREYAQYLKDHHLRALAAENVRLYQAFDVPLLKVMAHLTDEQLLETTVASLTLFLDNLVAGTALEAGLANLKAWEEDRLPGVPKEAIQPSDLVLVYAAQKQAMLKFIDQFTTDVTVARDVMLALETFYLETQNTAFSIFARMRQQAADRIAELAAALEREKAFIEGIVDHVPASVAFIDADGIVRWANPEFERQQGLGGRQREDFIGQPLSMVFGDTAGKFQALFEEVVVEGKPYAATGFAHEGSGKWPTTYWDFTWVPIVRPDGTLEGVLSMAVESTARVAAEKLQREQIEQLRQVDQMKDQFLSILSHELRTPVNAIMGFGSILDDEVAGALTEDQHRYLRKMLGGAETLLALINDLLDMSRIQAGRFTLNPEVVNFGEVVEQTMGHLIALAEHKHLKTELELPAEMPPVFGDPQRIGQVLNNLIGNAIKFTPDGGTIRIWAKPDGGYLRCEVQDTGVGIAEADLPKLFQRFTQLKAGNTRAVRGTGLGLSIAKALTEAHGGTIGVISTPGQGSTFWFTLPLAGGTAAAQPAKSRTRERST